MKATAFEFRLRFWIFLSIYALGFVAPWDTVLHLDGTGPNAHVWARLAVLLSKSGPLDLASAFHVVLGAGILCATAAAGLRTWASAYLGHHVVHDPTMHADGVVANGPYRNVRNPLYLGIWVHTLAIALLMPASGAIFTFALVSLFQMRLILGEESFLTASLGEAYTAYCQHVPRILPVLIPRVTASTASPRWIEAVRGEIYMWGVALSFAVAGSQFNALLLTRCVIVSVGVAIVVRAL